MNNSVCDDISKESDEQGPNIRTSEEVDNNTLEYYFTRNIPLEKVIEDENEKVSKNTRLDLEDIEWGRKIIDKLNNLEESMQSYDLETLSTSVQELNESSQRIKNDLTICKEFMQDYNVDEIKRIFEKLTKNCDNDGAVFSAPCSCLQKNQMIEIEKRLSDLECIIKGNSTANETITSDVDGKLEKLEKSVQHIKIFAENYTEDLQRIGDLEQRVRSLYGQDIEVRLNALEEKANKYMQGVPDDNNSGDSSEIKNKTEGQMMDFKESVEQCVSEIQNLKKFRDCLERDSLTEIKNRIYRLETSLNGGENRDGSSSNTINQSKRSTERLGIHENQGLFNFLQNSVEQNFSEIQYLANLRKSLENDVLRELRNRILRMEENYIPNLEDRICILEDSSCLVSVNSTKTSWFSSFADAGQLDDLRSLESRVGRLEESSTEQKLVGISARVARLERLESLQAHAIYNAHSSTTANVQSANDSDSRLLKALEALLERTRPSQECARPSQSTSGESTPVFFSSAASPNPIVEAEFSQKETNAASILGNALCRAAEEGRLEDVRDLLASGLNVNSTTHGRCTALHVAAFRGHAQVMDALVKAGADLNAQNIAGFTPLHLAAQENKLECVRKLLVAGASPQVKSNKGTTPLEQALKWQAHEAAMELRAAVKY